MNAYVSGAKRWLISKHINVPDDWLEACIEWISEENQGSFQSQQQVNELVFEQWLLSDLHELGSLCLPADLVNADKLQLNGLFALQVDSMVDVSQSCYSQLQKVKGTENANTEVSADTHKPWEPKPSRMLLLKLTDGTQNVQGMEYGSIPGLDSSLHPGCKILVQGNVLCRRGMLMLKKENVSVLGGEVDALMEMNSVEQILKSTLEINLTNADKEYKQEYEGGPTVNVKQETKANVSSRGTSSRPSFQANQRPVKTEQQNRSNRDEFDEDLPLELLDEMDGELEDDFSFNSNNDRASTSVFSNASTGRVKPVPNQSNNNTRSTQNTIKLPGINFVKTEPNLPKTHNNVTRNSFTSAAQFQKNGPQIKSPDQSLRPSAGNYGNNTVDNRGVQEDVQDMDFMDDDFDDDFEQFLPTNRKSDQMSRNVSETKANTKKRQLVSPGEEGNVKRRSIQESNVKNATSRNDSVADNSHLIQQKKPLFKAQQTEVKLESDDLNIDHDLSLQADLNLDFTVDDKELSQVNLSHDPWTYLSVVKKHLPTQQLVSFKVKAYISTLTGKLDCPGGKRWCLPCKINDGTMSLDVDLSDKVLTELIGFSAVESQTLRKLAKTDIKVRDKLTNGIKQCQEKLVQLICIMEVQICPQVSRPEVVSLLPISHTDISILADKVTRNMKK